jgi:putative hydrolase of the HAD superfamily
VTYRAVIFDLFDTLLYVVDTGTRETAIQLASQVGVTREVWRSGWGEGFELASRGAIGCLWDRVAHTLRRAGVVEPDATLVDQMTGLLHVRDHPHLYPDVRATLGLLRERGYRLGLLSNIASDERGMIPAFGFERMMDAVILSCDVGHAKPEPAIFSLALDALSVLPQECVFVDDRPSFLAAAAEIGMRGVRIARDNAHDNDELSRRGDTVVRDLGELLAWLPASAVPETRA